MTSHITFSKEESDQKIIQVLSRLNDMAGNLGVAKFPFSKGKGGDFTLCLSALDDLLSNALDLLQSDAEEEKAVDHISHDTWYSDWVKQPGSIIPGVPSGSVPANGTTRVNTGGGGAGGGSGRAVGCVHPTTSSSGVPPFNLPYGTLYHPPAGTISPYESVLGTLRYKRMSVNGRWEDYDPYATGSKAAISDYMGKCDPTARNHAFGIAEDPFHLIHKKRSWFRRKPEVC